MRLWIDQLGIRVKAPHSLTGEGKRCVAILAERLASELPPYLGPSLCHQREIVRIRELKIRIKLRAGHAPEQILCAWLTAFSQQLFQALALPSEPDGYGVYRAESAAHFRAHFIRELLRGGAPRAWYFQEFIETLGSSRSEAVQQMLLKDPPSTLRALAEDSFLEAVLSVLNDVQLERLLHCLSGTESGDLTVRQLLDLLCFAVRHPGPQNWRIHGHRSALRLWTLLCADGKHLPPRQVLYLLQTAHHLQQHGLSFSETSSSTTRHLIAELCQPHAALIWNELVPLLKELTAGKVDFSIVSAETTRWLHSDYAGLLLFLPLIEQLQWWRVRQHPAFPDPALSCLLAGIAGVLCAQSEDQHLNEPAIYFFSGTVAPIASSVYQYQQNALCWRDASGLFGFSADTFVQLCSQMADVLASQFAARIRGFRALSFASVRRLFVQRPGRIRFEPDRLHVVLEPSPYNIALHLAGADTAIPTSAWFQNRQITFHLEGL